jgi:hypothetical protein
MARGRASGKAKKNAMKPLAAKPTAAPASSLSKTRATKPTTASTKPPKSKADFVRAHPGLSAKEVVEKAKAEGIQLGWRYVYSVRASNDAGATKGHGTAKPRATPRKGASVARPITTASSAEALLCALGAEIGLGRAVGILAEERAKLRDVMGW